MTRRASYASVLVKAPRVPAVALMVGALAASATPAPGQSIGVPPEYRIEVLGACGYGWNGGIPPAPGAPRGVAHGSTCVQESQGTHAVALFSWQNAFDTQRSTVEAAGYDLEGILFAEVWRDPAGTVYPTFLTSTLPGWRGHDELVFTDLLEYGLVPVRTGLETRQLDGTLVSVLNPSGTIGRIAVDRSGAFNDDVFYEAWTYPGYDYLGIQRQDAAGNITTFSTTGSVGRFAKGGAWGTGLHDGPASFGFGTVLDPNGTATSFPAVMSRHFDWVEGTGFDGDMFTFCAAETICRITAGGASTVWATNVADTVLEGCGEALWLAHDDYGCYRISARSMRLLQVTSSPSTLNTRGQGNGLSLHLDGLLDQGDLTPLDLHQIGPMWISKVEYSGGTIALPRPDASPGCDDATQDGIWETLADRQLKQDGSILVKFSTPSDGLCSTMDGNRQDIIALLLDVPDGETAQLCISGTYPGYIPPVETCAPVAVQNQGNR